MYSLPGTSSLTIYIYPSEGVHINMRRTATPVIVGSPPPPPPGPGPTAQGSGGVAAVLVERNCGLDMTSCLPEADKGKMVHNNPAPRLRQSLATPHPRHGRD